MKEIYEYLKNCGTFYLAIGNCETPIQGTENGGNCLKN